ncbi:MAG: hypothetical protein GX495_03335 [Chloroflexi bacterium]|jgi:hypothetical protein|nr:hypothetical protein [Chloroflexota bacterium]
MPHYPLPPRNTRLGFHYFPDNLHYQESDLRIWLPQLKSMGSSWVTLLASPERSIPEFFIQALIDQGVEPVIHYCIPIHSQTGYSEYRLSFEQYARWGVHYIALFDRPNLRASWTSAAWAQNDLVERFLDIYLPLAHLAHKAGIHPVFSPLEPGGDYWDLAFLRSALRAIIRRNDHEILDALAFSAYAWTGNRPVNWGAGGPERWPTARPYWTPPGAEDHRGFRIFDWYLAIMEAEIGERRPVLLLRAGARPGDQNNPGAPAVDAQTHAEVNLTISQAMNRTEDRPLRDESGVVLIDPIPAEVLCCNFWLLSAAESSPFHQHAWVTLEGVQLPAAQKLHQWWKGILFAQNTAPAAQHSIRRAVEKSGPAGDHPIEHYLLVPLYEWGINEWHLDSIRPFVQECHPTIGFSLEEARLARRVTVAGGSQDFPDEVLAALRKSGCIVDRLLPDGTVLATV